MNQTLSSSRSTSSAAAASAVRPWRVAIVAASWHRDIVQHAIDAALAEFRQSASPPEVAVHDVPGAFEIPLYAQRLARAGLCDAVIACGLVVDGGIYRHDFVAKTVVQALMTVQLDTGVPMISAVLTPHHFHEHAEHRKYFMRHFAVKGTEAAQACLQTVAGLRRLDSVLSPAVKA